MQPYSRGERPLQKSMFLPSNSNSDQQFVSQNRAGDYQFQELKRGGMGLDSSVGNNNNKLGQFGSNGTNNSLNQFNSNQNNQILNFNNRSKDQFSGSAASMQNNSSSNQINSTGNIITSLFPAGSEPTLQQVVEKLERVSGQVQKHHEILRAHKMTSNKDGFKDPLVESQICSIEQRLKENVIPSLINKSNKEIYEHIFNFKLEIQVFKDNIDSLNKTLQSHKDQLADVARELGIKTKAGSSLASSGHSTGQHSILTGSEQSLSDFSAAMYTLENKLIDLQNRTKDESIKQLVQAELERQGISSVKQKRDFNSSNKLRQGVAKSTLPSYMIEYQELFLFKNPPNRFAPNKQSTEQSILINSSTYCIDTQGYLLDGQNRYILDGKGMQIKLEPKHFNLLQSHNAFG